VSMVAANDLTMKTEVERAFLQTNPLIQQGVTTTPFITGACCYRPGRPAGDEDRSQTTPSISAEESRMKLDEDIG
jgi:hypothetical protein